MRKTKGKCNVIKRVPRPKSSSSPPNTMSHTDSSSYWLVDSGASTTLQATREGLQEIREVDGRIETAAAGVTMKIEAAGRHDTLPGEVYVVPELGQGLISFHGMEASGYTYRVHPEDTELRQWLKDGRVVRNLTYKVFPNRIGIWHAGGEDHEYPTTFPTTQAAYTTVTTGVASKLRIGVYTEPVVVKSRIGVYKEQIDNTVPPHGSVRGERKQGKGGQEKGGTTTRVTAAATGDAVEKIRRKVQFVKRRTTGSTTPRKEWLRGQLQAQDHVTKVHKEPEWETAHRGVNQPQNTTVTIATTKGSGNRFELLELGDDAEEDEEEEEKPEGQASRASKLWTTVQRGSAGFLTRLIHAATHLGEQRLVDTAEEELMLNWPEELTGAAIRREFPHCLPCIRGKGKNVRADKWRKGAATTRRPVPAHRRHRDWCCEKCVDEGDHPPPRAIGDVVAIDNIDFAGGDKASLWKTHRYILAAVDLSTGKYASGIPHGGKTKEDNLNAIDMLISEYNKAGHQIKTIRCDHEFIGELEDNLTARGIKIEHSCPEDHHTNGNAERWNQTLEGHLRAILYGRAEGCPYWWPLALEYFIMTWNATSLVKKGTSAHTAFHGDKYDFEAMPLLPWGCEVEVLEAPRPTNNSHDRTRSGHFMGSAKNHYRCAKIAPVGATTDQEILIRRSYWATPTATAPPATNQVQTPDTWAISTAKEWLGHAPGLETPINPEERERKDMAEEERRSRGVAGDKKNVAHRENHAQTNRARQMEQLARGQKQAENMEAHRETIIRRKQARTQTAQQKKKDQQVTRANRNAVIQELEHATRTLQAAEEKERREMEGRRTSARNTRGTRNREFAYTAGILATTTPYETMATIMQGMMEAEEDLRNTAKAAGTPDAFDKVVEDWCAEWRVALARGESLENVNFLPDPRGWKQMQNHPQAKEFLQAAEKEIAKLTDMGAGTEVKGGRAGVPPGHKILRTMFTFVTKRYADTGAIEKYKARCVADGSKQTDVDDTHAPTIGATTLRIALAIAAGDGMTRSKVDVESAFLIEEIDKPTYVQLPTAYTDHHGVAPRVWKLLKSLYGLRQAPRLFWLGLKSELERQGFKSSDHDPCLFVRQERDKSYTYLLTHVDDIMILSRNLETNAKVKDEMLTKYGGITWEAHASTFLGLAFTDRMDGSLKVSQPTYTKLILATTDTVADGTTYTPNSHGNLNEGTVDTGKISWLRKAVGLVQFLTATRMEVITALNLVARQMHHPTEKTIAAMKRILQYIANRPDDGLIYKTGGKIKIDCWVDASWQSEPNNISRTGYAIAVGTNSAMVQAYSKAQQYGTLSSQEAEIVATTEAVKSVLHVRYILADMGLPQTEATPLHEDNVGCIAFANATAPLERTKHIANRNRFIREAVREGTVKMEKIATINQPANGLTKAVPAREFDKMRLFLQRGQLLAKMTMHRK